MVYSTVMLKKMLIQLVWFEHGSPANKHSCWNGLYYWGHMTRNNKCINQSDKSLRYVKCRVALQVRILSIALAFPTQ